mgnify:CR=1 FL=1
MDFPSITAALTGIKSASDIAKLIKESGATIEAAEIKFQMAELLGALADAKIEIANIKEMVLEKEAQIQVLQKKLETESDIKWEDPYYFRLSDSGEKDGPFCQKCYDSEKVLIRLQSPGKNGFWQCKACNSDFKDSSYRSESAVVMSRSRKTNWRGF